MNRKSVLGILVKFPRPGEVKTRLARVIGEERAAEEYRIIAERIMENTFPGESGYEREVFYTPADRKDQFEKWLPGNVLVPQRGADIGDIMSNALHDLFACGAEKAVLVGSDIPKLGRDIIVQAFRELDRTDTVVGPAADGGYYLIGMRSLHEGVFRGISWGSSGVLGETISAIGRLGLTWSLVPALSDMDTAEDFFRMKS
ncbi:MAG: TIGR04282 family arsenosugar biosynthesis glycosyltransferase [Nitrospirae bacterium]|nr:TIGR04282 family arsenosugar biosynthesis glycosyltransferase [Nitrospirota bacterium]